ncbi:DUF1963 domain-containing protein [Treponema socranskii]
MVGLLIATGGSIANFLINSNALKNRDFSNVLYTWDCY